MEKSHIKTINGREAFELDTPKGNPVSLFIQVLNNQKGDAWLAKVGEVKLTEMIEPVASAAMYGAIDYSIEQLRQLIVELEKVKAELRNGNDWDGVEIL